jgi:CheY-like chemotaxis protein
MSSPVLDDIRARFRETSRLRLGEMDLLLGRLEGDPGDAAALQQLARHFHALAGLGGTCGFPRVSDLGDEAEAMMLPLVRRGAVPDAAMLVQFRELTAAIGREIAGDDGVPAFRAEPSEADALAAGAASRDREEHPSRRILVVDDDEVANELFRGILSSSGYEVEVCGNPLQFEKMLLEFRPDLLLMDVQLSHELTGHDLVRFVRQSEQFSRLPVIIVTSDSERRAILEDPDAGADTLVTKPVNWDALLSHIAARLERAAVLRDPAD